MGTYIFSIKCSHWLKVSQTLAWTRVRVWTAAGTQWGWRKEQAEAMISEGNDPTPSLLFSQSASRFCTLPARGGRTGGRAPARRSPFPRPVLHPRRCHRKSPREAKVETLPGASGAGLGPVDLLPSWRPPTSVRNWESRSGAWAQPKFTSGEAEAGEEAPPGTETPSSFLLRPRYSRGPLSRQKSTFWPRISSDTPLFLLEQVNVRVGPRGPGRGHMCPRHSGSPRLSGSSYAIKLIYCDCSSLLWQRLAAASKSIDVKEIWKQSWHKT